MKTKSIHIISFDVPYPADYGGVIDVYYRIKALYELGFKIHLHCFQYGREESSKLNEICEKVSYYPRKRRLLDFFQLRPFIVQTRISKVLEANLLKDNAPILMEGLHCTSILENKSFKDRTTIVRTHNIEHHYYKGLSKTNNLKDFIYFKLEAFKLKRYESILKKSSAILAIQEKDKKHLKKINSNTFLLPICNKKNKILEQKETLPYLLFQGNLSVKENQEAILWLIDNVYNKLKTKPKFIVAGKKPSLSLKNTLVNNNIELVENPKQMEMDKLIKEARIHLLYTTQATGAKLKLINALQSNGHVILNSKLIEGTELSLLCNVCDNPKEFQINVVNLINSELSIHELKSRNDYFKEKLNATKNCKLIEEIITN